MARTVCGSCRAHNQLTATLCTNCGGFIPGPRSVPVGQESDELLAAMRAYGQPASARPEPAPSADQPSPTQTQPTIYDLARQVAATLREASSALASIGSFTGWKLWEHRWRTEEWPEPMPGAGPEQAIHNTFSYWLNDDGRLYLVEYEEIELFGWVRYPTPQQIGPRGIRMYDKPCTTLVDDARLESHWELLKARSTRHQEVDDYGHTTSYFAAPVGDADGPEDLLRTHLEALAARPPAPAPAPRSLDPTTTGETKAISPPPPGSVSDRNVTLVTAVIVTVCVYALGGHSIVWLLASITVGVLLGRGITYWLNS